ncbi:MAG: short-chain dehydrogenase [Proteobacteria bacterium]|nr:short-chain dehydrogenase [Pseudomonadota bacterium]
MNRVRHALVVGGSGMLAGLSRSLLDIGDRVSVLARSAHRVRAIAPTLEPVICDYNDATALAEALRDLPPPGLVVAWIHGRAPELRRALASRVVPGGRFVQVLGSAHGDPSHPERLSEMAAATESLPITYQAVVLGFVVEAHGSRWLTHEEISTGVFRAIMADVPLGIVGTVEPWSARP